MANGTLSETSFAELVAGILGRNNGQLAAPTCWQQLYALNSEYKAFIKKHGGLKKLCSRNPERLQFVDDLRCGVLRIVVSPKAKVVLVDSIAKSKAALKVISESVKESKVVAIDIEGDLTPNGRLSLIQVGLESEEVFIFDLLICPFLLSSKAGTDGLPTLLSGSIKKFAKVTKLLHDCRADAVALKGQFDIVLPHEPVCGDLGGVGRRRRRKGRDGADDAVSRDECRWKCSRPGTPAEAAGEGGRVDEARTKDSDKGEGRGVGSHH
jgi:hypothetical protein